MAEKIMDILARETGGENYRAHKYSLDHDERPSLDYGEDTVQSQFQWRKMAESNKKIKGYISLAELSRQVASERTLLTFFLDGSRRVFKVAEIGYKPEHNRIIIYPVLAGQIGVACCKRVNKRMRPEKFERQIVLSVPDIADANGKPGFFPAARLKINSCDALKKLKIEISDILPYKTSKDKDRNRSFEDRGTVCIQERMLEREREMVSVLAFENEINQDNYLVKDGSLEYRLPQKEKSNKEQYQIFKNNYSYVLGVSKHFNPELCLDINGKSNPGFIAELPLYHRTPAALYQFDDLVFALWYVRIRETQRTRTPFDGIIKVEKILATKDELEKGMKTELINLLSAYLINERNPVCYGSDSRWANHLYPVFLTESFVKSKYISAETFMHLF